MEVPTVNKSFFFLSLQNGGLLLSWLGLVASFSGLISAIVLLSIGVDSQLDNDLAPNEKKVSVASKSSNKVYGKCLSLTINFHSFPQ